jgi:para-nitrobenzyl esterase
MDMDQIKIENGLISGMVTGKPGEEVHVYRGIPYAAPPVGALRWKPPQPAASWTGVRECTKYSIQAAQLPDVNIPEDAKKIPSSEDCLYLNVLTPAKKTDEKLPVMVWFHGGGLRYGSGNWALYNSTELTRHGVILVTVNTRLGIFGLFTHPLVSQESPHGVSGNYLFLDMIASLQWVKRNISAFGGDPDRVTIFGQSGGGAKVMTMLASPLAKGLFHRAICESGGGSSTATPLKDMEEFGNKFFAKLGIDKEKNLLEAARSLSMDKIIEAEQALNVDLGQQYLFMGPWGITMDGWFIPDVLANIFKTGKHNAVPVITLATQGELTGPGYVVMPKIIPGYVNILSGQNIKNAKGYACIFDQIPSNWRKEGSVTPHAMELHYLFGALDNQPAWDLNFFLYAAAGAKSPVPVFSEADRKISEIMMKMWVQFAGTGNPGIPGQVTWPEWDSKNDQYLYINESLQVKSGFSKVGQ